LIYTNIFFMVIHLPRFLVILLLFASTHEQAQTVIVTSTYHNIGIELTFITAPPAGTTANLYIKRQSDPSYSMVHPLTRITTTTFAGSAVQLKENTAYDLKVSSNNFADVFASGTTKSNLYNQPNTNVFYVDSLGNDNNNGTSNATAFKTLTKALNSIATAGTTIYVRKGTYYEGDLNITKSGATNSPITIRNFPGEYPIINGTDRTFNPVWVVHDAANNVYKTASAAQPLHAYINGNHLFHYLKLTDLVNKVWSQPNGFFHDGTTFYVRFPMGATPGNTTITIPKYTSGIQVDQQSNIVIKGITFAYFGYGDYPRGIYLNVATSIMIDSGAFHHTHIGVALKRNSDYNTVQHCSFNESPKSQFNWDAVKTGGVDYEAGGICVYTSNLPNNGNVFRYNTFNDLFDAMAPGSEDLAGYSSNMDIYDNVFNAVGDDAISLDGVATNLRVYNNTISNYLTGISAAPLSKGPTYIFRNVLYNSNASLWKSNSIYTPYPFKFNVNSSLSTNWVYLYHNTSFSDIADCDGFLFKNYSDWHDIISRNNIYAGAAYAFDNWSNTNPIDFDFDGLYTSYPGKLFYWNGNAYNSLAAFSSATNQEINGIVGNPEFVSMPKANFQLSTSSSFIDKGTIIHGFNDDYKGTKPDIGKYESGAISSLPGRKDLFPVMTFFPNPSPDLITVDADKKIIGSSFFICDILGRKQLQGKLEHKRTLISLEDLIPGIYFFQLEQLPNTSYKLIKQ
jgi:hypothetical protein